MGKTFKDQRKYEVKELTRKSEKLHQKKLNRSIKDTIRHQIDVEFNELANEKGFTGDSKRRGHHHRNLNDYLDD